MSQLEEVMTADFQVAEEHKEEGIKAYISII